MACKTNPSPDETLGTPDSKSKTSICSGTQPSARAKQVTSWSRIASSGLRICNSRNLSIEHRRGIYVVIKRGSPYPSLVNFDATSRLTCTVDRSRTNTPLQALTLLNDPVYSEAARALAARVTRERSADSLAEQLVYAFRLCTGRQPLPGEQRTLQQLWDDSRAAGRSTTEAWQSVASVLLNLHETITKD